jgi:hypothetical protein
MREMREKRRWVQMNARGASPQHYWAREAHERYPSSWIKRTLILKDWYGAHSAVCGRGPFCGYTCKLHLFRCAGLRVFSEGFPCFMSRRSVRGPRSVHITPWLPARACLFLGAVQIGPAHHGPTASCSGLFILPMAPRPPLISVLIGSNLSALRTGGESPLHANKNKLVSHILQCSSAGG